MSEILFSGWDGLLKVALCSVTGYLALFLFIRISGKRTLSKLNAFDFVVAVTLGSTLSSMILGKVPLAEGVFAVAIIVGLQYLLAKLAMECPALEKVINSKPALLFYEGKYLDDVLAKECVTHEEVRAAVREFRLERMEDVRAVVMELNGDLTVVAKAPPGFHSSLHDIEEPS